jgi:hypothetical protein
MQKLLLYIDIVWLKIKIICTKKLTLKALSMSIKTKKKCSLGCTKHHKDFLSENKLNFNNKNI